MLSSQVLGPSWRAHLFQGPTTLQFPSAAEPAQNKLSIWQKGPRQGFSLHHAEASVAFPRVFDRHTARGPPLASASWSFLGKAPSFALSRSIQDQTRD